MASNSLLFSVIALICLSCAFAYNVSHDGRAIMIDGKRRVLLSGSIHYPRSTSEMWPDLIKKAKEGGLDAIETYVFWDAHEPTRRQYDFSGNLDLVRFIKTIQDAGLYAVLRIGPYVCAEWNYGGFPVWLHNIPGIEFRTANSVFMEEMQTFTTLIVDMMKKEKLFASQGGPIILAQIENEYGNIMSGYGDAGKVYIDWCAKMAYSLNIGVPWIMCQQSDAPQPMINTCNGWYCHQFTPNNPNSPKMWTENWTGWFKSWGGAHPKRMAEDVAYAVARFFQTGGTFQNYYMYHGGTNFGRTAGGPYITTTYDYDAPIDEYGNLNQPKWGHLKQLHDVLHSMEEILTHGNVTNYDMGTSLTVTKYTTEEGSSCFISNENTTSDATISFEGVEYFVPAWSVSISPDCKTEAYNTAKVNTQTSVMVRKSNRAEAEPESLKWKWRPEKVDKSVLHASGGNFAANRLLDQKVAAVDASDYLWYMTSVNIHHDDPVLTHDMALRVNISGQVLHAYVNGKYIGSQWSKYDVFKSTFLEKIRLNHGENSISLLSATVGFQNYRAHFDTINNGIPGPVELIGYKGDETIIKDLSTHKWKYKVGLDGFSKKFFDLHSGSSWAEEALPVNKRLTWYKTAFKAPLGKDPVVVDLGGMGKGTAWVNGFDIGRYWPSYVAQEDGCDDAPCDYRGEYKDSKCLSRCGEPTQRWYHVPRSVLEDGENTLVLFEEIGGNPSQVDFETISIGKACGNAYEGNTLELSCKDGAIKDIQFADFGNPQGICGSFQKGDCQSENDDALLILRKDCVGKETCYIDVSEKKFGTTNCGNIVKRLAVEAVC